MMPASVYATPAWVGFVPALETSTDHIDNRVVELTIYSDPAQDQIHIGEYRISRGHARRLAKLLLEADEVVAELRLFQPPDPCAGSGPGFIVTAQEAGDCLNSGPAKPNSTCWGIVTAQEAVDGLNRFQAAARFRPVMEEILDGDDAEDDTHA